MGNTFVLLWRILNLKKCSWYALHWKWEKGRPTLTTIEPHHTDLTSTTQEKDNAPPTVITRSKINNANHILGIYLSPDGDFSTQLQILKKKADTYAHSLRSPRLTPQDIQTFHRTTYGPSMRYVLPALALDKEELTSVQAKALASMLNELGHSSTLPTEIRHGPVEMGGLALLDLCTEIGIFQLKYLHDSVFSDSELDPSPAGSDSPAPPQPTQQIERTPGRPLTLPT